jgi:uncharacterized coiled-coil DUF342 family protein
MREDILQALSELIKEKTELEAEKIELSIFSKNLKGLKQTIKNANQILLRANLGLDEIENYANEYGSMVKMIRLQKKEIAEWFKGSRGFLKKVETQVKELGINANDIPDYKEYKSLFENLEKKENDINTAIKRAEAIRKKF